MAEILTNLKKCEISPAESPRAVGFVDMGSQCLFYFSFFVCWLYDALRTLVTVSAILTAWLQGWQCVSTTLYKISW